MHSWCLTGDVFRLVPLRLRARQTRPCARDRESGSGILLYLRQKAAASGLRTEARTRCRDQGARDYHTVEANSSSPGRPCATSRHRRAQVLADLGVRKIDLLTNNPAQGRRPEAYGLEITSRVPVQVKTNRHKPPLPVDEARQARAPARPRAAGEKSVKHERPEPDATDCGSVSWPRKWNRGGTVNLGSVDGALFRRCLAAAGRGRRRRPRCPLGAGRLPGVPSQRCSGRAGSGELGAVRSPFGSAHQTARPSTSRLIAGRGRAGTGCASRSTPACRKSWTASSRACTYGRRRTECAAASNGTDTGSR